MLKLNPLWLETFLSVCKTCHFTQTAQQLHMTQPGVSQHIQKIEQSLQVQLFIRRGRHIELTEAAEYLQEYANQLLSDEQSFLDKLTRQNPYQGKFHIQCDGATALSIYPKCLSLQKEFPGLIPMIEAAPHRQILENLLNDTCDLGISYQPKQQNLFHTKSLGLRGLSLFVPKEFDTQNLTFATLNQLGMINHPDGPKYADKLLSVQFPDHYQGASKLHVTGYNNQISQILRPVSDGLGYAILPSEMARLAPSNIAIQSVALSQIIADNFYLIYRKNKELPQRFNLILDLIDQHFIDLQSY